MIKNQKGLTAISWMLIIGFIATQAVVGIRIIPAYMTFSSVQKIMDGLTTATDLHGKKTKYVRKIIYRRLNINNIYTFKNKPKAFILSRVDGGMEVKVDYEERGPIFSNLDYVASFTYSVIIPNK